MKKLLFSVLGVALTFSLQVSAQTNCQPVTQYLVQGSSGQQVASLQTLLASQGYFNQVPTGYFGPVTQASVVSYQAANNISQTGTVGPITRASLSATCGSGSTTGGSTQSSGGVANAAIFNFGAQSASTNLGQSQTIQLPTAGTVNPWANYSSQIQQPSAISAGYFTSFINPTNPGTLPFQGTAAFNNLLANFGKGGSGSTTIIYQGAPTTPTVPTGGNASSTVTLSANGSSGVVNVSSGQPLTLSWSYAGVQGASCYGVNGDQLWTGPKAYTGSVQLMPSQSLVYSITCGNNSGQVYATDSVTVLLNGALVPTTQQPSYKYPIFSLKLGNEYQQYELVNGYAPIIDSMVVVTSPNVQSATLPIELTMRNVYATTSPTTGFSSCTLTPRIPTSGQVITLSTKSSVSIPGTNETGTKFTGSVPISGGNIPRDRFVWSVSCAHGNVATPVRDITEIVVRPITVDPYCMVGNSFGSFTNWYPVSYGAISIPTVSSNYDFEVSAQPPLPIGSIIGHPGLADPYSSQGGGNLWRPDAPAGGTQRAGYGHTGIHAFVDDRYKAIVSSGGTERIRLLPNGAVVAGSSGTDGSGDDSSTSFTEFWPKSPWGAVAAIKIPGLTLTYPNADYRDPTGTIVTRSVPMLNLPMTQAQLNAAVSYINAYVNSGGNSNDLVVHDPRLATVIGLGANPSLTQVNNALMQSSTFISNQGTFYPDYVIGQCK